MIFFYGRYVLTDDLNESSSLINDISCRDPDAISLGPEIEIPDIRQFFNM